VEEYDILLVGGTVVDGTGRPAFKSDIAIRGDRIVEVRPGIRGDARLTIDAGGLVVAPGFVGAHADKTLPFVSTAE